MQIMKRLLNKKTKESSGLWFLLLCFFVSGMQSCLHYRQQSRTDQNNEVEERQADSRSIPNEMEILC